MTAVLFYYPWRRVSPTCNHCHFHFSLPISTKTVTGVFPSLVFSFGWVGFKAGLDSWRLSKSWFLCWFFFVFRGSFQTILRWSSSLIIPHSQQVPLLLVTLNINIRIVIYNIGKRTTNRSESSICFNRLQCSEMLLLSQVFCQLGIFPEGSFKNLLSL